MEMIASSRSSLPTSARLDPYGHWAADTGFSYCHATQVSAGSETFIRLIAETVKSAAELRVWLQTAPQIEWLFICPEYTLSNTIDPKLCHFVTGFVHVDALRWLLWDGSVQPSPQMPPGGNEFWCFVKRFQICADVKPARTVIPFPRIPVRQPASPKPRDSAFAGAKQDAESRGEPSQTVSPLPDFSFTFSGLVDIGIPFANRECREWQFVASPPKSATRLRGFWDQQERNTLLPFRTAVEGFAYGREWVELPSQNVPPIPPVSDLVSGVLDPSSEETCYKKYGNDIAVVSRSHGAATLGELSSNRLSMNIDKTLDAGGVVPLLAVQLPTPTLAHSSHGALSAHVLDAIRWLIARAGAANRLVANVSLGTQAGPHDGSSILEGAIDELVQLRKREDKDWLAVTVAAGNSREARCHAKFDVAANASRSLRVRVLPDSSVPAYVEIWFPLKASVTISLRSPSGRSVNAVPMGAIGHIKSGSVVTAAVYNMHASCALGNDPMTLVAFASTTDGRAEAGDWTIIVQSAATLSECHAYVERNNSMFDLSRPRGRQARFVDGHYARMGLAPGDRGDSQSATIKRKGTLNSIATGREVLVVGAYVGSERMAAKYASSGRSRKAELGVDAGLPGDTHASPVGVRVAATRTGSTTRLGGTSVAAPRLARRLVNYFASDFQPYSAKEYVARVAAKETGNEPFDEYRLGGGMLTEACVGEPRLKY